MLITYLAKKCLRYNSLTTGKVDNQATRKSPYTLSISCKLTFTDKLNQKKKKPLGHLLHFYPAGSLNIQSQFERLKDVIYFFFKLRATTGLLYFPSGAILRETSTQSFKILPRTQYNSNQLEIRERFISDQSYSIKNQEPSSSRCSSVSRLVPQDMGDFHIERTGLLVVNEQP